MTIERASDNPFPSVLFREHVDPSNPASGDQRLFVDTDHILKMIDSSGTVTTFTTGAMVTDATITTTDVTTNNASTSKHGWLKKLDNSATSFMNGQGNWATPAGTGAVASDTIWDAKGDLAAGTGANTAGKLPVGANGTFLVPDSSQSTGLIWQAKPVADRVLRTAGDLTTTSTTFVDVTSLSITLTTLARRCLVGFSADVYHNTNQSAVAVDIAIDGTRQGGSHGLGYQYTISGNNDVHLIAFTYLTDVLSAASHTIKAQWRVTAAGTGNMVASSITPAVLWVQEQQ